MLIRSLFLLLPLLILGTANACIVPRGLTKKDVAFAEVMFEGEISEIKQETNVELVFKVDKVLRGDLVDDEISAVWFHGTFGYPKDIDEFVDRYGQKLRVALIMPSQAQKHCKLVVQVKRHKGIFIAIPSHGRCSADYAGFGYVSGLDYQPLVLNGPCSGPYMIDLEKENTPNFDTPRFNNRLQILTSGEVLFRIAQRYSELLDVQKFEDTDYQKQLIALGYSIVDEIEADMRANGRFFESEPAEIDKFSEMYEPLIIYGMREFAILFEEDPGYRDRIINYEDFSGSD